MKNRPSSSLRPIAIAILTTMATGILTAFASMYSDISMLKIKEKTLEQKVDTISTDVKDIKWFLIERNGGNIKKRGKDGR